MKKLPTAVIFASLLGLSACSGGGGGSGSGTDGYGTPSNPCDDLIAEMIDYLGQPDGPPTVVELNGDTGLFYTYDRHGGNVGLYYGPSFDGCEADIFET